VPLFITILYHYIEEKENFSERRRDWYDRHFDTFLPSSPLDAVYYLFCSPLLILPLLLFWAGGVAAFVRYAIRAFILCCRVLILHVECD